MRSTAAFLLVCGCAAQNLTDCSSGDSGTLDACPPCVCETPPSPSPPPPTPDLLFACESNSFPTWAVALVGAAIGSLLTLLTCAYILLSRGQGLPRSPMEISSAIDVATASALKALSEERDAHAATHADHDATRLELKELHSTAAENMLKLQIDHEAREKGLEEASQATYAALVIERHQYRDLQMHVAECSPLSSHWQGALEDGDVPEGAGEAGDALSAEAERSVMLRREAEEAMSQARAMLVGDVTAGHAGQHAPVEVVASPRLPVRTLELEDSHVA